MLSRQLAALFLIGSVFGLAGVPASGQDQTAQELFDQGMTQFQAEAYQAARQTLREVDPRQLPEVKDRETYFQTLIELDEQLGPVEGEGPAQPAEPATPAEPADTDGDDGDDTGAATEAESASESEDAPPAPSASDYLDNARSAEAAGDAALAADLYQAAIDHDEADDATRRAARAGLANLDRQASPEATAAKAAFDKGAARFEAGDYEQARRTLEAIDPAHFQGQWFYEESRRRMIAAAGAALARAEAEAEAQARAEAARQAQADAEAAEAAAAQADADEQAAAAAEAARAEAGRAEAERAAARQAAEDEAQRTEQLFAEARSLYAQQEVAAGLEAQRQGAVLVAIGHFERAAELDPDNQEIQDLLAAAQADRNNQVAPREPIEVERGNRSIIRAAAISRYEEAMNSAEAHLNQRDYAAASDFVETAKTVLDRNQRLFTAQEYTDRRKAATELSAQIENRRLIADAQAKALAAERQEDKARQEGIEAQRRQEQEVNSLLRQAMALRREMNYDQALELVDQALFLEPTNIAAQALKEMIEDSQVIKDYDQIKRDKEIEWARTSITNQEASIPYDDLLTYPADWPQITQTRLAEMTEDGSESEANRRASLQLRETVPINFEGNRLVNVIDYLRNTTGANFFVNWPALEGVGVEQDAAITLQLSNVPAEQALRLVLQQAGQISQFDPIGYSIIEGVVTIDTENNLKKTTDTRVYDIRDLLVQVPNFANAPAFDLNQALSNTSSGGSNQGAGGGGGGGAGGGTSIFGDDDPAGEDGPSRDEIIQEITTLIQDTVGNPEEWVNLDSSLRELNGNLIVKSTPENHRQIIGLLAQLRETRAIQIHVEARFLLVNRNFLENFNIDMDFSYVASGNFGPIELSQDSITMADRATTTQTPGRFGTGQDGTFTRALDFSVSYLDDLEVDLLVQATQAHQRSLTLTAPRVTFFNGQRAFVIVARQITFVSDLEPVPDSLGFDTTLSVTQSGVVLDVEGTISADRRYVTLTLRPSLATVRDPIRQIPVPLAGALPTDLLDDDDDDDDGVPAGGETVTGTLEAPELELTSVRTTVSIPDRGTLLIGGQRLVGEVDIEAGVPVLSKVPVLNRLFTNTTTTKDERTLLILVKPTIIIQSEQEEALFPGLLQNPDEFNVGGNL